ncbi:uncharacterized protein LACBIDRAFT_318133 [Laccaria bicolor S238N-H82]|uniref:Predicted protein n=1 Tax=Laccaria bicolor (strain S238N-H82 / ATCC MYA-4686) TaxID=486041 RepID=B0D627_LACBS|nr:uncharacterized protein LACBIDRAFT_318133 [Laccaria bicolor S238N-H82]EDR10127.1 predicted protein [Laccaria bicolor S238N-H82]|eukprot:XP_001879512.1 predicted protein [Laccaria bicolor S238N-H82]
MTSQIYRVEYGIFATTELSGRMQLYEPSTYLPFVRSRGYKRHNHSVTDPFHL